MTLEPDVGQGSAPEELISRNHALYPYRQLALEIEHEVANEVSNLQLHLGSVLTDLDGCGVRNDESYSQMFYQMIVLNRELPEKVIGVSSLQSLVQWEYGHLDGQGFVNAPARTLLDQQVVILIYGRGQVIYHVEWFDHGRTVTWTFSCQLLVLLLNSRLCDALKLVTYLSSLLGDLILSLRSSSLLGEYLRGGLLARGGDLALERQLAESLGGVLSLLYGGVLDRRRPPISVSGLVLLIARRLLLLDQQGVPG